jgi:hypothetical protein
MGWMWVMVVHHSTGLLLAQCHLKKFELDEDSTQAMKWFVIYLVFVCKHSVI